MSDTNTIYQNTIYHINEIFTSLQGEGSFVGTPSIFIRLQGCDVGCPWCDTKHTWQCEPSQEIAFSALMILNDNDNDNNNWSGVTLDELIDYLMNKVPYFDNITHIVITGGEPAMQNLHPLCTRLEHLGKQIQLETSGTHKLAITSNTWVTLSPKITIPNPKLILDENINRANEIKMPIGKKQDIIIFKNFLAIHPINKNVVIYLQPLSQNNNATNLCINEAFINNWRVSIQIHKFLAIR